MEHVEVVVFRGYGSRSSAVRENARRVVEALREAGYLASFSEVTVPVADGEEGFEPFVLVNGVEVYISAVEVDSSRLAEYVIESVYLASTLAGFPLPPVSIES
ncbi:hypothetical protein [Hyperthermus butylicus]|uniref:Uncharacterized protein n=1 Tax=Hyperthermus butylicus (strain DSM 5456 / JCM 9403 / PLM1-5) TaxID=415426 RepID=A2BM43_HYPBU|nr:hypothetical protein [Hyperthermus butylicus]ABM81054.1 hypothetical protein Hbut_1222 [Hyperthermus butylicus DSM 5456]